MIIPLILIRQECIIQLLLKLMLVRIDIKDFLVQIDKGVIFKLLDFFSSRSGAFADPIFDSFRGVYQKLNVEPYYLTFQFVTLFFICHEIGHLVQRINSNGRPGVHC